MDKTTGSHIDHILISKKQKSGIEGVITYREANADRNHYMVMAKYRQKISKIRKKWI